MYFFFLFLLFSLKFLQQQVQLLPTVRIHFTTIYYPRTIEIVLKSQIN